MKCIEVFLFINKRQNKNTFLGKNNIEVKAKGQQTAWIIQTWCIGIFTDRSLSKGFKTNPFLSHSGGPLAT